jgi:hypothetical protein
MATVLETAIGASPSRVPTLTLRQLEGVLLLARLNSSPGNSLVACRLEPAPYGACLKTARSSIANDRCASPIPISCLNDAAQT